jgi:hypothetical protein
MGKITVTPDLETRATALLRGFRARIPATEEEVLLRGTRMTVAGIHQRLEAIRRARIRVRKAKSAYENAVKALRALEAEDERFHDAVVKYLRSRFGRNASVLEVFGVEVL